MKAQEIFDKVAGHLLTQKEKALKYSRGKLCLYLTQDGKRCAIGVLIPDKHPGLSYIGAVSSLLAHYKDLGKLLNGTKNISLLNHLQEIHDQSEVSDWECELRKVAISHKLNTKALDKFTSKQP